MLTLCTMLSLSHVPTYSGCVENCCTPPHSHTISQVLYLKGSGGLEIHIDSLNSPFDILGNEILDVDAVFRDEVDQSTYNLYIGCGGCVASEDKIVIPPLNLSGYEVGEVEPFTQTRYRSVFEKVKRKFNTSLLQGCREEHFTIRLEDRLNRTGDDAIVWAPVIGLAESFTFMELFEFPIYILRNHGYTWNNLPFTFWIWIFVGVPLLINSLRYILIYYKFDVLNPFKHEVLKLINVREIFYELALYAFTAAAFEEFTHLLYVQIGIPVSYQFYVGLFAVIFVGQVVPIIFVCVVWSSMYHRGSWCISSPWWSPFEILTGFSFLFLFGAGFFVGPFSIMIAGIIRLSEIRLHDIYCIGEKEASISDIEVNVIGYVKPIKVNTKEKSLGFIK